MCIYSFLVDTIKQYLKVSIPKHHLNLDSEIPQIRSHHKDKGTFIEGKHKCETILYINMFYIIGKENLRTIGVGCLSFSTLWLDILKIVNIVQDVLKSKCGINRA